MKAAIRRYHCQWAAQFFVAAELSRRGYLASPTLGNAPAADLLAESPRGVPFVVEVKGQQTHNFWLIRPVTRPTSHRFFILVFVPVGNVEQAGTPRYFVLTADEVHQAREAYRVRMQTRGRKYHDDLGGFNWTTVMAHENRWNKLPR